MSNTKNTANNPKIIAEICTIIVDKCNNKAKTAPKDAPLATPSVSGVARGLENNDWKAAPAQASPAPAIIDNMTLGRRMPNITVAAVSDTPLPHVCKALIVSYKLIL